MFRHLYICLLLLLPLATQAQIQPQSIGTYKEYAVGGKTDISVSHAYGTDNQYFAFRLREWSYNAYFTLHLGYTKDEALESLDNLQDILQNGNKGEVYYIDDKTTIKKVNDTRLDVFRAGEWDRGYIQSRHIKKAKKFITNL
jgi:hypothetical protein